MKRNSRISALVGCALMVSGACFTSCTDSFESMNINPNEVTPGMMEQDNLKTGAYFSQMQRAVFVVGKDKGGSYQIHQMLNGDNYAGYFANIKDSYNIGNRHHDHYAMVSHWYDTPFNDTYPDVMQPWYKIYEETDENSVDRALATVVKVMAMHRMTDKYGPIPYTKFGTAINLPYDSQEDVYHAFFTELEQAIDVLNTYNSASNKPYMARYDYVYSGNVVRWARLANTLRLRLAMRVSYVDEALARAEIQKCLDNPAGFMTGVADDASLHQGNGLTFTNPIYEVTQGFNDMRMSATIDCYLNGLNDPRMPRYFLEATNGGYHGIRNGMTSGFASMPNAASVANFNSDSDLPWMHAAETYFLLAEAKLRFNLGSDDVQTLYEKGVRLSFESAGVASAADAYLADSDSKAPDTWTNPVDNRNVNVKSMLTQLSPAWDDAASTDVKLQRIMLQKWIALYPDGCEAWAEMRRTGYPGWVTINTYSYASGVQSNDIIRRIQFPSTEFENNTKNVQEAVTMLGGTDNAGTHLWWDCK